MKKSLGFILFALFMSIVADFSPQFVRESEYFLRTNQLANEVLGHHYVIEASENSEILNNKPSNKFKRSTQLPNSLVG